MKIHGFDILICSVCSQLYKNQRIASSNSMGASYFSDGYIEGPFIPVQPRIIKCINENCGQFLQISQLKMVASVNHDDEDASSPDAWETAYDLVGYKIGLNNLKEALHKDICNSIDNEIIIRTQLLWRYNDLFRKDSSYFLQDDERDIFINNIDRLIVLNQDKDSISDKLFLAELYREKSDFEHCFEILKDLKCEKPCEITLKEKIFSQSKIRKDRVFDVDLIAVKKEYKCSFCNDSIILFDLENLIDPREYRHFICKNDNTIFNDSLKIQNPISEYRLNKFQKLLNSKKPHEQFIDNPELACPVCKGSNIVEFKPDQEKCIKCGQGNYIPIDWFNVN